MERDDDFIDWGKHWAVIVAEKWLVIGVTVLFALGGLLYGLLATPVYRAEAQLLPVSSDQKAARMGGLAQASALLGISLGGDDSNRPIAVLKSRALVEDFIRDENLLPVLFPDAVDGKIKSRWGTETPLDIRDGVRLFDEQLRTVSESRSTGVVTLAVQWSDAELAAEWARKLVAKANEQLRRRDIALSEQRLKYLKEQLNSATVAELRQAISRVIENEIKSVMLAEVQAEYAFETIDPPIVPKQKISPRRTLLVLVYTFVGAVLGFALARFRHPRSAA